MHTSTNTSKTNDQTKVIGSVRIKAHTICDQGVSAVSLQNLNSIGPHHLVVMSLTLVERLRDLSHDDYLSFWHFVRSTQVLAEGRLDSDASNVAIKDGVGVGQPFPQVHAHVVPRSVGDSLGDDKVYNAIDLWAPEGVNVEHVPFECPPDSAREPRTFKVMAAEANQYRTRLGITMPVEDLWFAEIRIQPDLVFYTSPLSRAFVNLKPLLPGHVLVTPTRCVARLHELSTEEFEDLVVTAREVQHMLEAHYGVSSAMLGIQDGKVAGQSVPHVHIHIIPGQ